MPSRVGFMNHFIIKKEVLKYFQSLLKPFSYKKRRFHQNQIVQLYDCLLLGIQTAQAFYLCVLARLHAFMFYRAKSDLRANFKTKTQTLIYIIYNILGYLKF